MTKDHSSSLPSDLTFSQRTGLEPLPTPLAFGEISLALRNDLWTVTYDFLEGHRCEYDYNRGYYVRRNDGDYLKGAGLDIVRDYFYKFHNIPIDELGNQYNFYAEKLKNIILKDKFNIALDFVSHFLGHAQHPEDLPGKVQQFLEKHLAPYCVIDNKFIAPATTEQEAVTLSKAFADTKAGSFEGAYDHLRKAVACLNETKPDFVGCARESIHAVESVVRKVDPKSSKTLDAALNSLRNHIEIHSALESGMRKLYGYSSDEEGVRHALLDPPSKVKLAEALFILGACASFVSYVITKAREAGLVKA